MWLLHMIKIVHVNKSSIFSYIPSSLSLNPKTYVPALYKLRKEVGEESGPGIYKGMG